MPTADKLCCEPSPFSTAKRRTETSAVAFGRRLTSHDEKLEPRIYIPNSTTGLSMDPDTLWAALTNSAELRPERYPSIS